MALPTEEPLPMRGEVDFGRIFLVRFFRMALGAKFPRLRLGRGHASWAYLMLCRSGVTCGTANQRMGRSALDIRDLGMTGRTLARSLRRHRIMGLVTGRAGLERIVNNWTDLRKTRGPRRIVSMAEGAEFPSPGSGRLVCGVFYMRLGGPVACFTIDVLMKPFAFLCHLVDVAGAANRRPSEGNVFCEFSFDRGTMMKLRVDQRGGENDISYRDNRRDDNPDDNGESLYLLRNLFQRSPPLCRLARGSRFHFH